MRSLFYTLIRHVVVVFTVFICIFLYVAAGMTQTGWFNVISSFILGFLIVSFFATWWNAGGILLERKGNVRGYEGEHMKMLVRVSNRRRFASYALIVKDPLARRIDDAADWSLAALSSVAGRSDRMLDYRVFLSRRGVYAFPPLVLESCFPVSLFMYRKVFPGEKKLIVYPSGPKIKRLPAFPARKSQSSHGEKSSRKTGGNSDFKGIRDYTYSDGLQRIYWPKSTSGDQLFVKEFTGFSESLYDISILLDNDYWASVGTEKSRSLEYFIKLAASLCEYGRKNGISVNFLSIKSDGGFVSETMDYETSMYFLASMESGKEIRKRNLSMEGLVRFPNTLLFVFTSDASWELPSADAGNVHVLFADALSFGKTERAEAETYMRNKNAMLKSGKLWKVLSKDDDLKTVFTENYDN